ncbi:MAG: hypothetical protein MJ132_03550 [Clostridia bacterium]|nr:hypothetical protein [Clostridia bacterium]
MSKTILYNAKEIRYFGRTPISEEIGARFFDWSGSGFAFSFEGTSARAKIVCGKPSDDVPAENDRAYIGVFVDGNDYETARFPLDGKDKTYTLAENLPYGKHTVYVVKETEMWYGRAGLAQIECDGEFCEAPAAKPTKIEFIGDSITCGYGNLCSNKSGEFVTREENFSNTYAALTAKMLDSEASVVAASGSGFFHDYGCSTSNLIPELYEYTDKLLSLHTGNEPERWNYAADSCNAVVIKLGQNDGQYCSGADLPEEQRTPDVLSRRRADYQVAAYRFFMRIIELRPDTPILYICEEDMLLKEESLAAAKQTCKIETLVFKGKREYEDVGANGHYSVYTHARVAKLVANKLKDML